MARDLFQEAGISIGNDGEGRDLFAEAGITPEPKDTRKAVPKATIGSVAQDIASGVLQIGPTAVKGVADIARLATGDRVGTDTSAAMDRGMASIRDSVGSDRAAAQRANFQADMADDEVGIGETLARNKGALADQLLPTIGSMFLPVGVAGAAGKLATAGKAAQALDKASMVERVAKVQQAAGIGAVAAQNAADTFAQLLEKGASMEDAYLGAGITVPFSVIAGRLTGGGAEGAITRALTGSGSAKAGVKQVGTAMLKEGGQEMGEEAGQITGQAVAMGEAPSAMGAAKQLAVAGTLGAVMGGGVDVANQAGQFAKPAAAPAEQPAITPETGSSPADQAPPAAPITPQSAPSDPTVRLAELEILAEQRDLTPVERAETVDLLTRAQQEDANGTEPQAAPVPAVEQAIDAGPAPVDAVAEGAAPGPVGVVAADDAGQPEPSQPLSLEQPAQPGITGEGAGVPRPTQAAHTPEPILPPMQPQQDVNLQNRDRGRAASVVQMSEIARNPDYMRLGPSRTPDSGAPMVFAVGDQLDRIAPEAFGREDVAVMSDGQRVPFRYAVVDASKVNPSNFADGRQNPEFNSAAPGTIKALNNGRTAGVRAAHEMGTAGEYVSGLQSDAALHGVPADVIARTPNPMLVRVYADADNTSGMAAKSQGQGLGMSPAELARQDAPLMDSSVLGVYEPGEVTSAGNRDFTRAFIGKLQAAGQDVAGMMTGDGQLSQDGRKRIQAALMQAAYGDSDIVEEMFDSTDTDIKAIGEALKSVAGQWANMRDSAKLGAINPQVDITQNLLQAIGLIRKARRDNTMVFDLVNQPDLMTGEAPDVTTVALLRMMYSGQYMTRAVGKDKLAKSLGDYVTGAMATSADAGMFGDVVTPLDILTTIIPLTEGQGNAETQPQESSGEPVGSGTAGRGDGEERAGRQGAGRGGAGTDQGGRGQSGQDAQAQAKQQVGQGGEGSEKGDAPTASSAGAQQPGTDAAQAQPASVSTPAFAAGDAVAWGAGAKRKTGVVVRAPSGKEPATVRADGGDKVFSVKAEKLEQAPQVKPRPNPGGAPENPGVTPKVKTLPSAGTFKSWSTAVPKIGTVNGWTLFRDELEGVRYVLMTPFNSVGFDTEEAARAWAKGNKATKGDFNENRESKPLAATAEKKSAEGKKDEKLSPADAAKLMEWQDMGTANGVKTHALHFYESQADKDAKRGRMTLVTVTKGDRSATAWTVDGSDQRFDGLAAAKKLAMELGMARAVSDSFVTGDTKPAEPLLTAPTEADIVARQDAAEAAQRKEEAADRAAKQQAEQDEDRKRIAQASVRVADTFELGQDPLDSLTGQQSMFDAPQEPEKPVVSANTVFTEDAAERARARLRSKLGRLNSGIDPETMMDGITLAGYHIEKGARTFAAYARAMLADLGEGAKPYLKSWYMGVKYDPRATNFTGMDSAAAVDTADIDALMAQENSDVPRTDAGLESDRQEPAAEPAVGNAVPADAGGNARKAGGTGGQASGAGRGGQQRGAGVPVGSTTVGGERSDFSLPGGNATVDAADVATGSDFSERGSDIGLDGVSADPIPAAQVDAVATTGTDHLTLLDRQRAADKVPVKSGDMENIKATLPYLLEGQQEDVKKTEDRFAQPDGYGMLFTNGTGTGKTFTGLGVVKRMQRQGKTNTLIVVPDDKIAADWIESGVPLGLKIIKLKDTRDAGTGIVIATYANMGENDALASRGWDLVVADESHTLMQSADGKVTTYLANLRAITHHPDGANQRYQMQNRADIDQLAKVREQIEANDKIMGNTDTMAEMVDSLKRENAKLEAEASALKAKLDAARAKVKEEVASMQGPKRARLLALSATPFAYEFTVDWANGYLFDYAEGQTDESKEFRGYNQGSNRDRFFMQHFGYSMRYNKLTKPDPSKVDTGLLQRTFNGWLRKKGALSARMLDVPADYDRRFVLVDSAIGNQIDDALNFISESAREGENKNGFSALREVIDQKFDYLSRRYLLEAIKATEVVPIVRQHMALGRKVVVFHDYKKGGGFNPFNIEVPGKAPDDYPQELLPDFEAYKAALTEFRAKFKGLVNSPLGQLPSPIAVFKREFPEVLLVNGDEKKADLLARYKRFQDDASGPQVMLVQSAKNKGWSGHDTTGKHQRVLINLGQPTAPTLAIQQEGRIYRTGQVTDAPMRYLNTGTNWEKWAFATTIAGRASTAENLGMGEQARALKDSFIAAFEESDAYPPGHEGEGKGGKERDKLANAAISAYDRAKTYYWATQKKNSKTKAQEGVDYFATPEPVGFKMAEWLGLRGGESSLEPSGGHGAIARWLPEVTNRTVIEPSNVLRARLAMAMDTSKDRLIDGKFEDYAIVNKHDGIAMNPPFGVGGKTAIEHLAKAATHLRDGGRIVALIPTGPAADKRFDQWMYGTEERAVKPLAQVDYGMGPQDIYRGDTIKSRSSWAPQGVVMRKNSGGGFWVKVEGQAGETSVSAESIISHARTGPRTQTVRPADGIYTVGEIRLPQVTFERAGTAVATRIVILEKQSDKEKAPNARSPIDLTGITDIKDLFDRIEDISMPPRAMTPEQESAAKVEQADAKARQEEEKPKAAKAPKAANPEAVGTVDRAGAEIVEHVTQKGKTLRGIVREDLLKEEAQKIDPFTFRKNGGWFIRDVYLKGDTAMSRSQPGAMTETMVRQVADTIKARWASAPEIIVVPNMQDLRVPKGARAEDARQRAGGATGVPRGFFLGGKVYLVADGIKSVRDAAETLFHEALGHYGLRAVFGSDLNGILDQIADARMDLMRPKAAEYGKDLKDAKQRREVAEEVLAEMAQTKPNLGYVKRAIAIIRTWLRKNVPALKDMALTDAEIINSFILPARGFVERGGVNGALGGKVAFTRSAMKSVTANMDRGLDALAKAVTDKTTVHRAMFRNGLGWVDFVWGDEGSVKPNGRTKGGRGLSHIVEARMRKDGLSERQAIDVLGELVRTIAAGEEFDRKEVERSVRVGVRHDGYVAWLTKQPGANAWVVTGYEIDPDRAATGRATAAPTTSAASRTRDGEGAGSADSMSQGGDVGNSMFSRSTLGNTQPQPPQTPFQKLKAKALALTSPEAIDSLIYELQDKNIDLKRLRDHIKELGGTITDLNDAYLGEELYHKRVAKRTQDFLSEELKPLLADLRARGLDLPTLERFLHARHAPEANRVLAERNPNAQMIDTGRTKAAQDVKALEVQLQRAKAQGTATKAIEQALDMAREELSRWRGVQAFKGTEEERLSLSGMSDAESSAFMNSLPAGQRVHLDALAARVDAMNAKTLDTLGKYGLMDQTSLDAWRNTYQHYVPLHRDEAHPDAVGHPVGQGFSTKGDAGKRRTGSNEKVTNILAHIAMQREAALTRGEKNRVAKKLYLMAAQNPEPGVWAVDKPPMTRTVDRETGFVRSSVDPTYKNKPNVVMVRIAGKDQAIVFNERNPIAVRMAQSIKSADLGDLNAFDSIMGKATRWLASVNTQYNPVFGIINFARDVQAAVLQLSTTALAGQERAVAAHVPAALKGIYAEVRSRRKGQGRGTGDWAKLWEDMQDEGGTTGYRELFIDPKERVKALESELKALDRGEAKQAFFAVVDWLSDYNETMENAVRLSAYKVALEQGMSKERAASLAKNLTVNFNRRGRQTAKLGAYYAFLNAAIQGTTRMAETLRGPMGKKIMLGGVMLGAVNALLAMTAMGAGEDDDEYAKIPDFVKERSIIIPLGSQDYLAIPMPLGYHVLPNMGRKAMEMMLHNDPTVGAGTHVAEMARLVLDAFNPLGGSTNMGQMLAPTPFDPAIALMQNRDWTGKPIYREDSSGLDPTPGHTRTKDSASWISRHLSELLGKATGGTDYQPGAINWTPDQIDYIVGQLTGGVGRELMKVETTLTAPLNGDELPPHKIPLVGRVYGNTRGPASESEKFYENLTKLNGVERELKGRARDGQDVGEYMAEEPMAALVGMGNAAENQLSKLRQYRREVVRQGLPGYQSEVKDINAQIGDVMKSVNQEVRRARLSESQ